MKSINGTEFSEEFLKDLESTFGLNTESVFQILARANI